METYRQRSCSWFIVGGDICGSLPIVRDLLGVVVKGFPAGWQSRILYDDRHHTIACLSYLLYFARVVFRKQTEASTVEYFRAVRRQLGSAKSWHCHEARSYFHVIFYTSLQGYDTVYVICSLRKDDSEMNVAHELIEDLKLRLAFIVS